MELLSISGRKEIIAEFKDLVSSFPEEMDSMQRQLSNCKEAASDIHSLRADVQSLSTVLDRKVGILVFTHLYFWIELEDSDLFSGAGKRVKIYICFLEQAKECENLSVRSANEVVEIQKLQSVV